MTKFLLKISVASKSIFLTTIFLLTGVICYAQPANDDYADAFDVSSLINGCSTDAFYTTVNATPDLNAGSNWNNNGPLHNVWFSFVATAAQINVIVDIGGVKGNLSRTQLALWEADGTTELISDNYFPVFTGVVDVDVGYIGLTIGNTYYISIDGHTSNSQGTFTLCLEDSVDYDFYEGAIDVDYLINSCSNDAEFSTDGAAPDKNAGLHWNTSGSVPVQNRWFKFTATSSDQFNITVDIGNIANGPKGNQHNSQIALWEADGVTEVSSTRYDTQHGNLTLGVPGLTPNDTYYISIDATNASAAGSFTLCLDTKNSEGNIVINEVFFNETASGATNNDEFIELYNAGITAVDIAGWQLMDGNLFVIGQTDFASSITGDENPFTFSCSGSEVCAGTTLLQPGDYAVIWIGEQTASKDAANAVFQAWLGGTTKLNDTGDDIWLYDTNTTLVDYVAYGTNGSLNQPPLPVFWDNSVQTTLASASSGQSISLSINGIDGNSSDCWEPSTSAQASARCAGYLPTFDSDGSTRIASPGSNNNDPDTDEDGITDSVDLDDDNDGILDVDECLNTTTLATNGDFSSWIYSNSWTGTGWNINANRAFYSQWNGSGSKTFEQVITVAAGSENTITFDAGSNASYTNESTLNVKIDGVTQFTESSTNIASANGGNASGNATLNMGARSFTFIPTTSTVTLTFEGTATANNHDLLYVDNVYIISGCTDFDGDGVPNIFDLDSDNDGIYDAVEAGHDVVHIAGRLTGAVGLDGVADAVQNAGQEDSGTVNYTISDANTDGAVDFIEVESDSDGCLDVTEAGYSGSSSILGELSGTGYDAITGVVTGNTDGYTTPLDGDGNATYDYREAGSPSTITTQPQTVSVAIGGDAIFSVVATGTSLGYQWQLSTDNGNNYTDIAGATSNSYTEFNVSNLLEGYFYRVQVTNLSFNCTSTTSDGAILIIAPDNDNDGISDVVDLDDDNDGIPDTDEQNSAGVNSQNDCSGETTLDFSSAAILQSGTALQQGAVYRIYNVTIGIDALVTIVETNNATVDDLDDNSSETSAFRPRTSFNLANVGDVGYIEYNINFVNSSTTTPAVVDKFFMNFNDIDGNNNFGEQSWSDNPTNYITSNPTELTMTINNSWLVGTSGTNDYGGSSNANPEVNFGVSYTSKSEVSIRVGAVARTAGASASGRQHNIEFSCITNYENPIINGVDSDSDGIPDYLDLDSDNDGIYDAVEAGHNMPHTNGVVNGSYGANGLADVVETTSESGIINYSITNTDGTDTLDFLDTDSDNDGCSDANEAYGNANADGSDNEYYGTGLPPSTNANGAVTAASYSVPEDIDTNTVFDFQEAGMLPTISLQPENAYIADGANAVFSATATGTNLSYQWQVSIDAGISYNDISGETGTALTISGASASEDGNFYRLTISDSTFVCDAVNSDVGVLIISPDTDNDGIVDITDLDDDNDGILDTDEGCGSTTDVTNTIGFGTTVVNNTYPIPGTYITYAVNNPSSDVEIKGYDAGANGPAIRFEGLSVAATASVTSYFSSPVSNVEFKLTDFDYKETLTVNVYDENNVLYDLNYFGVVSVGSNIKQSGNTFSTLPLPTGSDVNGNDPAEDSLGSVIFFFPEQVSSIEIKFNNQNAADSSIRYTQPTYCSLVDTDTNTIIDQFDTDSDDDGCNDAIEAGFSDPDDDGILGTSPITVDANGLVIGQGGYTTPSDADGNSVFDFQEAGTEPTITTQPENAYVADGANALFSVTATGTNLTYQWQVSTDDGISYTDISGEIGASLTINGASASEDGNYYRLTISDSTFVCSSVNSGVGVLIVSPDTDNDGIIDVTDLDDDNDGILDIDEFQSCIENVQFGWLLNNPGGTLDVDFVQVPEITDLMISSFGSITSSGIITNNPASDLRMSGITETTFADAFSAGHYVETSFSTSTDMIDPYISDIRLGWWNPSQGDSYTVAELISDDNFTTYTILAQDKFITDDGSSQLFTDLMDGARYDLKENTTYTIRTYIYGHVDDSPENYSPWDDHTVTVNACFSQDTDLDGIADHFDSDSDGDGCNDAIEAGFTDPDDDGFLGTSPITVDANGLVIGQGGYTTPSDADGNSVFDFQEAGTAPTITTQPENAYVADGANTLFSVTATGTNLTYQWQVSTDDGISYIDISGETGTSLTINGASASEDGNYYRLTISDSTFVCDSVNSDVGVLIISPDTDNDGIIDITDLDDDNDGILDTNEGCGNTTDVLNTIGFGATVVNSTYSIPEVDITYIVDNPSGLEMKGFDAGANGSSIRFQGNVVAQGSVTSTFSNPVSNVGFKLTDLDQDEDFTVNVYDENNVLYDLNFFGVVAVGSFIEQNGNNFVSTPSQPDADGDDPADDILASIIFFFPKQVSRIVIEFDYKKASDASVRYTEPTYCSLVDTDTNTIIDQFDTDSDGDGCNDAIEAGFTDPDDDGVLGTSPITVDANGLVIGQGGYTIPSDADGNTVFDFQEAGIAPAITTQPLSSTICPGCSGSFTITADNTDSYQWQLFNGTSWVDLTDSGIHSGTTTSTLSITNPSSLDTGNQYRVIVSNSLYICSTDISEVAILTVNVATVITNRRITHRVKKN